MGCCRSRSSNPRGTGANSQVNTEDVHDETVANVAMDVNKASSSSERSEDVTHQKELPKNDPVKESVVLPPPRPYRKSKKDLIPNVKGAFSDIDSHADKAPDKDNMQSLANYLFNPDRPGRLGHSDS